MRNARPALSSVAAALLAVTACSEVPRAATPAAGAPAPPLALPAAYRGVIPCADCEGIRVTLDLFADGVFFERLEYLGKGADRTIDDVGTFARDGARLTLSGGREAKEFFEVKDAGTLRKLDLEGREIVSRLPYELKRLEAPPALEPRLHVAGVFTYMADAASFRECRTSRRVPVAMQGDYLALEKAYAGARPEPGAPVLASLDGRFAYLPPMEGRRPVLTLVVERFVNVQPGKPCPAPQNGTGRGMPIGPP